MEQQIQLGIVEPMLALDASRITMKKLSHFNCKTFIKDYHYSHKMPGTQLALGFFIDGRLNCIILYGQGISQNLANICGKGFLKQQDLFELCRLFSFDWAPKNMESYCIAQSLKYITQHLPHVRIIISFADPAQGHLGRIYQATNWLYTGTTSGGHFYVNRRGIVEHPRMMSYHQLNHPEQSRQDIADRLGWTKIKGSKKHRYIYLLGHHKDKKELRRRIVHPILAYPKTNSPSSIDIDTLIPNAGEVSSDRDTSSFHEERAGSIPAPCIPISHVFDDKNLFENVQVSPDVLRQVMQYKVQRDVLNKKQHTLFAFQHPSLPTTKEQSEGATNP